MTRKKLLKKLDLEHYYTFNVGWANEFEVNVCVTPDVRESRGHRDEILGTLPERIGSPVALFCGKNNKGYMFFPLIFDPDTVAHETYHLVDYMMDRLGVEVRDCEVMAYHIGWIVGKVSEIYLHIKKLEKITDKRVDTEFEN